MPELPEVEFGRKVAESVARARRIVGVHCADDPIVFAGVSPAEFEASLIDRQVLAVRRRGKHIWFGLSTRPWPLFHFGMTGEFRVPGDDPLSLESTPAVRSRNWPPPFTKIRLHFDDGGELVMTNPRRLGRIRLRQDPEREPPISLLGFDPLLDPPRSPAFFRSISTRRAPLKAVLLDQTFAAGVGNWIADEVLYQAGLDPRRPATSLTKEEASRLRAKLVSVVRTAVSVDARKERFPKSWLFHFRWGRREGSRTSRGEMVEFAVVAGRTTAWVPAVQR